MLSLGSELLFLGILLLYPLHFQSVGSVGGVARCMISCGSRLLLALLLLMGGMDESSDGLYCSFLFSLLALLADWLARWMGFLRSSFLIK